MPNALSEKTIPPAVGSQPGHNQPPSPIVLLTQALDDVYSAQILNVDPIAKRANDLPKTIETDDDLKLWGDVYLDARDLHKTLDGARLNETRPIKAVPASEVVAFAEPLSLALPRASAAHWPAAMPACFAPPACSSLAACPPPRPA